MEHIFILIHILTLTMGIWSIFYSNQMAKTYGYPFLRAYNQFIIFYNLMVVSSLTSRYIFTNLLDQSNKPLFYQWISYALHFFIVLVMTYTFLKVTLGLRGKSISSPLKGWLVTGLILFGLSYGIGVTVYIQTTSFQVFDFTDRLFHLTAFSIQFAASICMLFHRTDNEDNKRKAIRTFGILYILVFTFPFLFFLLPHPLNLRLFTVILFLLLNLNPIIWLRQFFLKYYLNGLSLQDDALFQEVIAQKYKLTGREQEIIELILQGKSNKEIKNTLFLSVNTVRNHIYSLYQKLGVKSRGQLVHLILEAQKIQ